jgi:hypothetical protein
VHAGLLHFIYHLLQEKRTSRYWVLGLVTDERCAASW